MIMSNHMPIHDKHKRLSQLSNRNASLERFAEIASSSSVGSSHSPLYQHTHEYHQLKDDTRLKELEDSRSRISQMEKSMKWYSDCAINWREKWTKVRNERNKSRDETRFLRNRLESVNKELFVLKREKSECESQISRMKSEFKHFKSNVCDETNHTSDAPSEFIDKVSFNIYSDITKNAIISNDNAIPKSFTLSSVETNDSLNFRNDLSGNAFKSQTSTKSMNHLKGIPEAFGHKLAKMKLRVEEANKLIDFERQEKDQLCMSLEKLQLEYGSLKYKYTDLMRHKKRLSDDCNNISENANNNQSDKLSSNSEPSDSCEGFNPYERIIELRNELEKIEYENCTLEKDQSSDNETLKRETRKLHNQLCTLEERFNSESMDSHVLDIKSLQNQIENKNKELEHLKRAHKKLKIVFQEKCSELSIALKRAEHSESETKKLKNKIEELTKNLSATEDEVNGATETIRKLQNANQELDEQIECLQSQLHQSRFGLTNDNCDSLIDVEYELSDSDEMQQQYVG